VLVPAGEMVDRVKAAVDARPDPDFMIMARTDALAVEGLDRALERASAYVKAGADMVFAEAVTELDQYTRFAEATGVPILANITEFGATPLFTTKELGEAGVGLALYPLSAFRAASAAALEVYEVLRRTGSQAAVVDRMQTREELYAVLGYHDYERKLDELFGAPGGGGQET
jgi:methylisocitrate lyase